MLTVTGSEGLFHAHHGGPHVAHHRDEAGDLQDSRNRSSAASPMRTGSAALAQRGEAVRTASGPQVVMLRGGVLGDQALGGQAGQIAVHLGSALLRFASNGK